MQGIIIKGIGGFYYVKVDNKVYECKARGKFRHKELSPLVGDNVIIDVDLDDKGIIKEICNRTSKLIRPSIANVTQAFIIFAVRNPDFNMDLLNKFLVLCEVNKLKAVVCFNKIDLATKEEVDNTISLVKSIGYETIYLNAKTGYGIDKIKAHLKENITVFCGPSGVGKSTILNSIVGHSAMETGDISKRLNRGKHTTRHCELLEIDGGYVADSPGFSSLDISFIKKNQLQMCFPELLKYYDTCKFSTCMHYKEPGCTVKEAVESGEINENRYKFYIKTLEEILSRREWK